MRIRKSPRLGIILAPLAGALAYMLLAFILGEDNTPKKDYTGLQAWPVFVAMYIAVALICYMASILIGVPLSRYLKRHSRLEFWLLFMLSIPIGAASISGAVYLLVRNEAHIFVPLLIFAAYGAVTGAVVSATYCWLAGITTRLKSHAR
ncbi:MAG TPA: hypothetical protein VIU93_08655 [Gallionellaceae bacterium]